MEDEDKKVETPEVETDELAEEEDDGDKTPEPATV